MNRLIVYAKRPVSGYAKTRLGAAIGAEQSAGIYARLLYAYLLDLVQARLQGVEIELAVTSPDDAPFFADAFPEWIVRPQMAGDLGKRMEASFRRAFAEGAENVVLTGTDIPGLNSGTIRTAFQALETSPVVIGPAADGGYYLIGERAPGAPLFTGIAWSSSRVLNQTKALAKGQGLAIAYLSQRYDLDTVADYKRWKRHLGQTSERTQE